MNINYSLLAPIALNRGNRPVSAVTRRAPGLAATYKEQPVGLKNPHTTELLEMRAVLGLTAKQLSAEISKFHKMPISSEVLQSYFQGFVKGAEKIEEMRNLVRAFADSKINDTLYFDKDMRSIIAHWFDRLGIDPNGKESPYRLFTEKIAAYRNTASDSGDFSTLFRWNQANRKPRSNLTIKEIDDAVEAAYKADKRKGKK